MSGVSKKVLKWCGETTASAKKHISLGKISEAGKTAGRQLRGKK